MIDRPLWKFRLDVKRLAFSVTLSYFDVSSEKFIIVVFTERPNSIQLLAKLLYPLQNSSSHFIASHMLFKCNRKYDIDEWPIK